MYSTSLNHCYSLKCFPICYWAVFSEWHPFSPALFFLYKSVLFWSVTAHVQTSTNMYIARSVPWELVLSLREKKTTTNLSNQLTPFRSVTRTGRLEAAFQSLLKEQKSQCVRGKSRVAYTSPRLTLRCWLPQQDPAFYRFTAELN